VQKQTFFQGTDKERMALLVAIQHNCVCHCDDDGPTQPCPPHAMLLDQRVLDGLVFARRIEVRLVAEEFSDAA
jgi:hypothetical protein